MSKAEAASQDGPEGGLPQEYSEKEGSVRHFKGKSTGYVN